MTDFDSSAWRPFLRSLDGNAPTPEQTPLFERCAGRTTPFTSPPRQAQACCGRRSGKTRIAALVAATAACFWRHDYLSRGERGRIMLLATSKDQSTVAKNYVLSLLESDPVTKALIDNITAEEIILINGIDIVIRAASFRGLRGHTCPLILADEVAFWQRSRNEHQSRRGDFPRAHARAEHRSAAFAVEHLKPVQQGRSLCGAASTSLGRQRKPHALLAGGEFGDEPDARSCRDRAGLCR
jgi:hypothetical protein